MTAPHLNIHAIEHADAQRRTPPAPWRARRHLKHRRWPLPENRPRVIVATMLPLMWLIIELTL